MKPYHGEVDITWLRRRPAPYDFPDFRPIRVSADGVRLVTMDHAVLGTEPEVPLARERRRTYGGVPYGRLHAEPPLPVYDRPASGVVVWKRDGFRCLVDLGVGIRTPLNRYEVRGETYSSIRKLAEAFGLSTATVQARWRRGESGERLIRPPDIVRG